jgi:predicted adenylyl cyclase CyaB
MESTKFIEQEVKFAVDGSLVYDFKKLVEDVLGIKDFVYVQSKDVYYTKGDEFLRYRFADDKKNKRAELTYKAKLKTENNIIRKEVNLRVDSNDMETIEAFVDCLGYKKNFEIMKSCHIYHAEDATLVFYSVRDEKGDTDHFIEIEVMEGGEYTVEQGWDIIRNYEEKLVSLGINAQKRLKKSLFEMYRKKEEKKESV